MKKKKPPYIPRKGVSRRQMYEKLEKLRQEGYDIPPPPVKTIQRDTVMTHNKFQKHKTHPMIINWALTNAHGNPALCCGVCTQATGKRAGKPMYIDWLSKRTIQMLTEMGVEERHEDK